jgi:selenocysteine lyase/cysteine desulfurase
MRYRNFPEEGKTLSIISRRLLRKSINTTVSLANHARLDMGSRELDEVVRACGNYYNTEEENERLCEVLAHC